MTSALAAPEPSAAQRERIAKDRRAVERDAQQAQQACTQQFAVTDCVNRAKAERRERLRPLEQEQALLDETVRKRRAAERLAQIQLRQAAQSTAPPEVAVRARRPAASAPLAAELARPEAPRHAAAAGAAETDAARRADATARRAEQAQAHRVAVEEKNRRRAAQRVPAKPLPLPPAASR